MLDFPCCPNVKYSHYEKMLAFRLISIVFLCLFVRTVSGSNMGTEESLRQNILDIFTGKLKFSDETLPYEEDELSDTTPKNQSEYDFIVVGAGSAGATIASRLSEIPEVTVLLIEAGGKEYSLMDIPTMAFPLQYSNEVNWNYKTESSDQFCLGMTYHQCLWPRGKVMGGSSVLNMMIATRGNRRDYDQWAIESGDNSWSYENMLKYFKKLESFQVKNVTFDGRLHNEYGPVRITGASKRSELTDAFNEAVKSLGYSEIDVNGIEQRGVSYWQSTIFEGERWSANRAYLRPAKSRSNLIVTQHSHVHKILIDNATKIAYGVRYSKYGQIFDVRAKKEIILSAGVINSPQILMLSGVGPKKHLQDLNIDVIRDAPVGENLKDHIACGGLIFKVNDSDTYEVPNMLDPKNSAIRDYLNTKTGPLSVGLSLNALAFMNVDNDQNLDPNLEMLFVAIPGVIDNMFASLVGIDDKLKDEMAPDVFNHSAWMVWPTLLTPRSSGKIILRSNDPFEKPMIYPNYLADAEDIRILIKGVRLAIKLSKTQALSQFGSELYQVPSSCQNHEKDSDKYWECVLRTYTNTVYHPVGTCKMGRESSENSVIDSKLKVIGIHKLRVADASIMPNIVSGHTNIPVIAIAEKASDLIKKEHGLMTEIH